jgi:hypothetical protein
VSAPGAADPLPPVPATWPFAHRGPSNRAYLPEADPPSDPHVESVPTAGTPRTIVVGSHQDTRRVLVGGLDGVAAHDPSGAVAWRASGGDAVAVRPDSDVCYVAGTDNLRAHDFGDGREIWTTASPGGFAVVPSSRGPLLPYNGGVDAYDRDGNRRWRVNRGGGFGHAGVAIADAVYVTDVGMTERLSPRGRLRRFRGRPPAAAWRVERHLGFAATPVVDDDAGEVYVTDEEREGRGGVVALTADGSIRWNRELGQSPAGATLGPDRLYVSMAVASDSNPDQSRLYALRRSDGRTDWSVESRGRDRGYYGGPALAGETLVVGGESPVGGGQVGAFSTRGDRRWTRRFDDPVWDVTPVADRVYAVTRDGRLHLLT